MAELTRMARAKRSKTRVALELDGEVWTDCADNIIAEFMLYQGKQISPDEQARIEQRIVAIDALAFCHASIARRAQTRTELGRKLRDRGYRPSLIEQTLDRCEELGLLDDAHYAAGFVRGRTARGHGPRRIRQDLGQRGVAKELIDAALAAHADDEEAVDPVIMCVGLLEKRFRDPAALDDLKTRAKAQRFLFGRGFASNDVNAAVRTFASRARA